MVFSMNSDEFSLDMNLPVAAYWQEITLGNGEDASDIFPNQDMVEEFTDDTEFVKLRDAEEAVKEARQRERQRIREKIEEKISDVKCDRDLFMNPDNKNEYTRIMNELEELRDDLQNDEDDQEVDA